jgi:signal transduction histidine kinase
VFRTFRRIPAFFGLPGGRETVRALALFSTLLVALAALAYQVSVRDMEQLVRYHQFNLGRREAGRIAEAVRAVGIEGRRMDFARVRRARPALQRVVEERLLEAPHLYFAEVRDRFGAPILAARRSFVGEVPEVQVLRISIVPWSFSEGEVRVGYSSDAISREVEALRQGLKIKVALAAGAVLALLAVGFAYVLHLLRKNRRLEDSKLAAERNAYKGLLASGLAHEIRNPLNAMNMNLQMLEEELQAVPGLDASEPLELLGSTKNEIRRLESLVTNFLLYARPSPPKIELHDVGQVLRDIATFLQADFRGQGVALQLDVDPLLPAVGFDDAKIRQALMNILVNARQVLKEGGTVTLRSRAGGAGEVLVEIQDDGPGMTEETRTRIFEPFYSQRRGGTGLGLPIAKLLVEQHGGSVEVLSETGKGATFRIRLPRQAPAAASPGGAGR